MLFGCISLSMCQKVLLKHDDIEQAYNGLSHSFCTTRQKNGQQIYTEMGKYIERKSCKKIICTNVFNIFSDFLLQVNQELLSCLEDLSAVCYIFSLCLFFARFRSKFILVYNFCNKYPLISKQLQPIAITIGGITHFQQV